MKFHRSISFVVFSLVLLGISCSFFSGGTLQPRLTEEINSSTRTPAYTNTVAPTNTPIPTPTVTSSPTPTVVPTNTPIPTPTVTPSPTPITVEGLVDLLTPSTVLVINMDEAEESIKSTGTGIIYNANGLVITNAHVVDGADKLWVYVPGHDGYLVAQVVGISYCDDLALLDIEGGGYTAAKLGSSADARLGGEVVALGYPYSYNRDFNIQDLAVTKGIISQLNESIDELESVIRTDADLNPGNSGGPLINMKGEVIGINTVRLLETESGNPLSGYNFAISIDHVKSVIAKLESGENLYWIGISYAKNIRQTEDGGIDKDLITIYDVIDGSPASRVGFLSGDRLLSIASEMVFTKYDICRVIKATGYPEQSVKVEVIRGESLLAGFLGENASPLNLVGYTSQTWVSAENVFPVSGIREKWADKYYITDLTMWGKYWVAVMSQGVGFTAQGYFSDGEWDNLVSYRRDMADKGFGITSLAYGNGEWTMVVTKGTGYQLQAWTITDEFPDDFISDQWDEGYRITELAYGGGSWAVVMSKETEYSAQSWITRENYPRDEIQEKWDEGYAITEMTHGEDRWVVVFSKGFIRQTQTYWAPEYWPTDFIVEKRDAGYAIEILDDYYDGWIIVMAK